MPEWREKGISSFSDKLLVIVRLGVAFLPTDAAKIVSFRMATNYAMGTKKRSTSQVKDGVATYENYIFGRR